MPSGGAAFDAESQLTRARLRTGELLAARGIYGYVWLDGDLVAGSRLGTLVEFIELGRPVSDSVPALIGLEAEIKALRFAPEKMLRLPSISIVSALGSGPRLNLIFHASDTDAHVMMIVSRADTDTLHAVELSRQIRGRLMAESEVAAKSQELARANAELKIANGKLEQFAAIATHDLKAPMRAIGYLADEIEGAIMAHDGERARQKLGELRSQAKRVSSMLTALLHYSSAGRGDCVESVDVRELIEEIVRSLPRGTVEVMLEGAWPRIETVAAPLALTLRNLIDNSIKHHDRPNGELVITCADAVDALEITLADDGPGIAPEHHASMFLPFRTLGSKGEGMGLAIVQKMLDAVGGTVTLQSDPARGRGATFTIRWPKQVAL